LHLRFEEELLQKGLSIEIVLERSLKKTGTISLTNDSQLSGKEEISHVGCESSWWAHFFQFFRVNFREGSRKEEM
jgi:hypothetical protein